MEGNSSFKLTLLRRRTLSRHAAKRVQQVGIDERTVPLILAYGERQFDGQSAIRYVMNERALGALRRAVGQTHAGVYVVIDAMGPMVITAGHRKSLTAASKYEL